VKATASDGHQTEARTRLRPLETMHALKTRVGRLPGGPLGCVGYSGGGRTDAQRQRRVAAPWQAMSLMCVSLRGCARITLNRRPTGGDDCWAGVKLVVAGANRPRGPYRHGRSARAVSMRVRGSAGMRGGRGGRGTWLAATAGFRVRVLEVSVRCELLVFRGTRYSFVKTVLRNGDGSGSLLAEKKRKNS
jgi:hypothetical protein